MVFTCGREGGKQSRVARPLLPFHFRYTTMEGRKWSGYARLEEKMIRFRAARLDILIREHTCRCLTESWDHSTRDKSSEQGVIVESRHGCPVIYSAVVRIFTLVAFQNRREKLCHSIFPTSLYMRLIRWYFPLGSTFSLRDVT